MKKSLVTMLAIGVSMFFAAISYSADLNKDDAATIAKDGMGIGMKKAELIVAERTKGGPFKDWANLQSRVKGFGVKTIEKNATTLTFGPAVAAVPGAAPAVATPAVTTPATAPIAAPAVAPVAPVAK